MPQRKLATFPQGAGSPDLPFEAVSIRSAKTVGAGDSLGSPSDPVVTVIFRCPDGRKSVHCRPRPIPITIRSPCKGPSQGALAALAQLFSFWLFFYGGLGGGTR